SGPQFLPKEAVARFSSDTPSNIVFMRMLMDAVSLQSEQVRILRTNSNNGFISLWNYLKNKFNHLLKRRAAANHNFVRPTIDGV
ncbi:hypothetical protein PFISCL1PPCAC_18712, partial [Pristionchus fissidentatus]